MNRSRLAIAVAAALLPVATAGPARAATGSFLYWSNTPDGTQDGQRHQLNNPPTGPCLQLVGDDRNPGTAISKVENDTDTPAAVYENNDCTGHRLMAPPKATKTAGGHGPHGFASVKFRPAP